MLAGSAAVRNAPNKTHTTSLVILMATPTWAYPVIDSFHPVQGFLVLQKIITRAL
jgi:hypothetical protein